MPKRVTPEETIQSYFDTEPLMKCELMANLINAKFKQRRKAEQPAAGKVKLNSKAGQAGHKANSGPTSQGPDSAPSLPLVP